MVTLAVAVGALPSFAVAVMRTLPPGGGVRGAVYTPAVVIDPHAPAVALSQRTPQVTAMGALFSVALNVCWPPAGSVATCGLITTNAVGMGGAGPVMVTEAVAVLVVSACEIAVIVTVAGFGTVLGAV